MNFIHKNNLLIRLLSKRKFLSNIVPSCAVGSALSIVKAGTDKPVYGKYEPVTFTIQVSNNGTRVIKGIWVNVWIDKMPVSILNRKDKYHDPEYIALLNKYKCLAGYMPDPNPSYSPVPNSFIAVHLNPGGSTDITLQYPASGEYTRLQDYTVRIYEWDLMAGKNRDAIILNSGSLYGEADSKKGTFAIQGYAACSAYPGGKSAAFVVRIDDVNGAHRAKVERLLAIMNKHSAKGTFVLLHGGASVLAGVLKPALAEGHEVGVHGKDHMCTLPASEHVPETLITGEAQEPFWHEFEGPHFNNMGYKYQYKRIKQVADEIEQSLGVRPLTFCAPQVAYSETTFKAVRDAGLEFSSNFPGTRAEWAYEDIIEIPYIGDYTWGVKSKNYQSVLEAAQKDMDTVVSEGGVFLIAVHPVKMNKLRYKWIDDFLSYADTKNVWYATVQNVGKWFKSADKKAVLIEEVPDGAAYMASYSQSIKRPVTATK